MTVRLLLVEDDGDLRQILARRLRREGFAVDEAEGLSAVAEVRSIYRYDCVVLDRMLPEGDALEHLAEWRTETGGAPVLVLTARRAKGELIAGLAAGADDYVTKPFDFEELVARVRAVCRRRPRRPRAERERWGDLEVDRGGRVVRRRGAILPLTQKELALLDALIDARGTAVSRRTLIERCWDEPVYLRSNALDVHIRSLRRKLGDPPLIRTVRGRGYVLEVAGGE